MLHHWLWVTATKTLHTRALRVIFARLWQPVALGGWRKFYAQCFRGKPSKIRGRAGKVSVAGGGGSVGGGEGGEGGEGGGGGESSESEDEADVAAAKAAREAKKRREIRSIGDLGLEEVLGGRERLLDELRHQVEHVRDSHVKG
jgi:predicted amidohydrolase YtcJ